MNIEIITVSTPVKEQKGNNSYEIVEVAYKTDNGRVQGKKLVSFSNPEVFKTLAAAKQGDKFSVESVKEGQYWNWKSLGASGAPSVGNVPGVDYAAKSPNVGQTGGRVTGSNYETPVEREWNRTRIGRQACLNTAVALVEATKAKADLKSVIETAGQLEEWVNRKAAKADDVSADVPF